MRSFHQVDAQEPTKPQVAKSQSRSKEPQRTKNLPQNVHLYFLTPYFASNRGVRGPAAHMLIAATAPVVNMAISNIPPNTSRESTITACTSLFNCVNTCCRYSNDRFHLPLRHLPTGKNDGKGRCHVLSRPDGTINVNVTVAVSRRTVNTCTLHTHASLGQLARCR